MADGSELGLTEQTARDLCPDDASRNEALAKLEPALFQEDDWVFEGAKEPPLVM